MPTIKYPPLPAQPREPRSLYHPQPHGFTGAGENLTFEVAAGEANSFPRVHLLFAECQGNCLRFRFPLQRVELRLSAVMRVPDNVTNESQVLLEEILSGAVSVLYAGKGWATEPPAHARAVQAIEFSNQWDPPQSQPQPQPQPKP